VIPVAAVGTRAPDGASEMSMQHSPRIGVEALRRYRDRTVLVELRDRSQFVGKLRIELLTEKSISVFITRADGTGATLYIDEIATLSDI
jgi:hypothetical protein